MLLDTLTILFQADTGNLDGDLNAAERASQALVESLRNAESVASAMRAELSRLRGTQLNIDDSQLQAAERAIAEFEAGLRNLNGNVNVDTTAARAQMEALRRQALEALRGASGGADTLSSDLTRATQEADRLNRELAEIQGGAEASTASLGGAFKALAGLAAGFWALGSAKASFTETVDELVNIKRTADSLNLDATEVDAFGRSMVAMGGDAQGARDTLVDMAESIGEAVQDAESGRAKVYAGLKISLKDVNGQAITATEGMLRLADAVSGMSKEEAIFRIKELGITDNRSVELILKGRKEMERMLAVQKEQSGVTKEAVENAAKYKDALGKLNNAQDSIATQAAATLLPAITAVVDIIAKGTEWARKNSQTVAVFFGAIAAVVAAVYLPAMVSAAAATLAATWPLIAIGALVTGVAAAFALLYDDVQNFMSGNDSFIGQISEKYPMVGETVKAVVETIGAAWEGIKGYLSELWDAIGPLGAAFSDVFGAAGAVLQSYYGVMSAVVSSIAKLLGVDMAGSFTNVGGVISSVMSGIVSAVRAAVAFIVSAMGTVSKVLSGVGGAIKTVAGLVGAGGDDKPDAKGKVDPSAAAIEKNIAAGKSAVSLANSTPLNSTTSGAISNTNSNMNKETNVQVGEVIVNTQATDAQGIAKDVSGSLQSQLAQVDSEFSTGVAR